MFIMSHKKLSIATWRKLILLNLIQNDKTNINILHISQYISRKGTMHGLPLLDVFSRVPREVGVVLHEGWKKSPTVASPWLLQQETSTANLIVDIRL